MSEDRFNSQTYDLFWKCKLKSIKDFSYSNDGTHIILGLEDGRVYLFSNNGNEIWQKKVNNFNCIDISGNASKVVIGTKTGSLYILSNDGELERELKIMGFINSLSISNNAKLICAGTNRGIIFCFDEYGNELWKHKIKGNVDGGISYSSDDRFIAVGSWNTVQLLNIEGKIIWKYKFNKKINDVALANDGCYIATCTKKSFAIVGNGTLIHEKIIPSGFSSVSICDNHIYAVSSNSIFIFNENGENIGRLNASECLKKICVNASKEFISVHSENRLYVLSSLMKPDIVFLTDKLNYGKEQTLKIEIINKVPKEINLELELVSEYLEINASKSTINILPNDKSIIEFDVTPRKIGEINVDLKIKNKKINYRKIIEVVPPKIELDIKLHPKYDFNVEDDEITILIDIKNIGKVTAKRISVEGYENLFLSELEVGSTGTLAYKINLPSGDHKLSNKLICEDERGNESLFECSCDIRVEKAPFVWGIKQPIPKFVPGRKTIVGFNIKNIKNGDLNLMLSISSEQIKISPRKVSVSVSPFESKDIEFEFTPIESGEKINLDITIEYNGTIQKYSDSIKVDPKPPDIKVKVLNQKKNKYRLGEDIYETIELFNVGECKATNIQIPGLPTIPVLEAGEKKKVNITKQNDIVKHYKPEKIQILYQDDCDGEYCTEFTSREYSVFSPEIRIKVPEINLQENVKQIVYIDCENTSCSILNNIWVYFSIKDDAISLYPEVRLIDRISPDTVESIPFEILANKEGEVNYDIIVKRDGKDGDLIEKHSGKFVVTSKVPILEFQVDDSGMFQNNYSVLRLKITNKGDHDVKNVNIKLQTSIPPSKMAKLEMTSSDNPDLSEIKSNESKECAFEFVPDRAGTASITIISSCMSIYGKTFPEQKEKVYVKIQQEVSKPEATINIGEITQGSAIFKGDTVVQDSTISTGFTSDKKSRGINTENISNGIDFESGNNRGSINFEGDAVIQNSHLSTGNSTINNTNNIIKYKELCVAAYKDGVITDTEREYLNEQAELLGLTKTQIQQIEDGVFKNKSINEDVVKKYREQATQKVNQMINEGKTEEDVRDVLNMLKVDFEITEEQQKQINDEILEKYIMNQSNIKCPKCNNITDPYAKYCGECGNQLE